MLTTGLGSGLKELAMGRPKLTAVLKILVLTTSHDEGTNKKTYLNHLAVFKHFYSLRWRRQWHPTPVLLPGKSHGWRSLVGCSPWGR